MSEPGNRGVEGDPRKRNPTKTWVRLALNWL